MKKAAVLITLILSLWSCSFKSYSTRASSVDEASYLLVLSGYPKKIEGVVVRVDNEEFFYHKVFSESRSIRMRPIECQPGLKYVKVTWNERVLYEDEVFLGNGETRKIVLR